MSGAVGAGGILLTCYFLCTRQRASLQQAADLMHCLWQLGNARTKSRRGGTVFLTR